MSSTANVRWRMPSAFAAAEPSPLWLDGEWNFASSIRPWPSGVSSIAISARTPSSPTTRSTERPSTDASPCGTSPSSTKNSVAAARSSTTMPTWSIRWIVISSMVRSRQVAALGGGCVQLGGPAGEPGADLGVDRRVIEEPHVIESADVTAVLDLERDPAPAAGARSTRVADEHVARQRSEPIATPRQRRADEVVRGAGQERDLVAAVAQELVRVLALAPVLLDAASEAKILDPGASAVEEEVGEGPRLRQAVEWPGREVGRLLQRRTKVRRAEADDVARPVDPLSIVELAVAARASRHESSH